MAKWGPAKKNGQCWRYGRGSQKFGLSWDRQKMEERERARQRKREAKAARRAFENGGVA